MNYPKQVWDQLKNVTANELISALERDGWSHDESGGSQRIYRKAASRRVSIHYHAHKTYDPTVLKHILADIGWSVRDLKRLKLIKPEI